MKQILCLLILTMCLLQIHAKEKDNSVQDNTSAQRNMKDAEEQKKDETSAKEKDVEDAGDEKEDNSEEEEDKEETKEFVCNLKYKRIGCYADKGKKEKPLASFLMSDSEMGKHSKRGKLPKPEQFNQELPKFACKCANEALTSGNAIFGLQNIAECWSGPDDSVYDKDGPSNDCVTFDFAECAPEAEICSGKRHSNFMYYIDTPDHTKTEEEINKELSEEKEKQSSEEKKTKKKTKKKSNKTKKSNH